MSEIISFCVELSLVMNVSECTEIGISNSIHLYLLCLSFYNHRISVLKCSWKVSSGAIAKTQKLNSRSTEKLSSIGHTICVKFHHKNIKRNTAHTHCSSSNPIVQNSQLLVFHMISLIHSIENVNKERYYGGTLIHRLLAFTLCEAVTYIR